GPLMSVNIVPAQTVNAGQATAAVIFSGFASAYNWTNDSPVIGLPASGSGNILSFTAINNTSAPITATLTVTPYDVLSNCSGPPVSFTITVNPVVIKAGITAGVPTGYIL